jgi:hypothetical protein
MRTTRRFIPDPDEDMRGVEIEVVEDGWVLINLGTPGDPYSPPGLSVEAIPGLVEGLAEVYERFTGHRITMQMRHQMPDFHG